MAYQHRDEETGRAIRLELDRYDCELLDMLCEVAQEEVANRTASLPWGDELSLHLQLQEWVKKVRKMAYEVAYEDDGETEYRLRHS